MANDYKRFIEAFIIAHPLLKKQEAFNEGQKQWKELKEKLEEMWSLLAL